MLAAPMLDPTGAFIVELREHPSVAALVGRRVRSADPAPPVRHPDNGAVIDQGDVRGPGDYVAFIVVKVMSAPPDRRLPIVSVEFLVECYGTTFQNAWAVYGAVVQAVHGRGPRTKSNGLGIYNSFVVAGGDEDTDPDTHQPLVNATVRLIATTAPVVTA